MMDVTNAYVLPINSAYGDGTVDQLRATALCDDPRNPGSTAVAVLWLAAEVRELRQALTAPFAPESDQ